MDNGTIVELAGTKMKRITGIILIVICAMELVGCSNYKRLTLEKVIDLSSKGYELTWSDFEQYRGYECGSGLYIMRYDIDKDFYLLIGGMGAAGSPMYIRLCSKSNEENYIDIRTDDVELFISNNS